MASPAGTPRPPSAWWLAVTGVIWALAAGSLIAAIAHQSSANQPIGEGEVFVGDADTAARIALAADDPHEGVRHARNSLDIEAVSLVDGGGLITASTSESLTGRPLSNSLLAFGVANTRFAALAGSVEQPLEIDGVIEWPAESVLYQVLAPVEGGNRFVLLHYDVSELLGRRSQPGDIEPLTIQLLALGGVFVILGTAVFVGHSRAVRRHREMVAESELLRTHARQLEEANVKLAQARRRAERALTLAEEKMRIRSEFVLMINHELRTPLTAVVTGAELIRDGHLDHTERQEIVESMVAQGNRLNEIIDQILAVARVENRGLSYELESVPLEDVCRVSGAHIDEGTVPRIDEVAVETDMRTLTLVLGSLSDNARTHGASRVELRCSLEPSIEAMMELGDRPSTPVYFTVSDDGPGIDPEFLPRAFEKFEKKSFSSGTGLGLYMVRLMVDALGGSIAVHTTREGTTFQIAIPARREIRVMEAV